MNWRGNFSLFGRKSALPRLPDNFIFGVATADHQCEACIKGWEDIRDIWEPSVGKVERKNATEFWDRYKKDIRLAKELNCRAFRFSVSWSRVEAAEQITLDHYSDMVDEIIHAGMEPVLTLHHFVWPPRVHMIDNNFPYLFQAYVTKVVERLGERVKYWVPINEPNHLIWGYIKPFWDPQYGAPPGEIELGESAGWSEQIEAVGKLIPNLYRAYSRAYDEIKRKNSDALVGENPWTAGFPPWLQWLLDWNAQRLANRMRNIDDWKNQSPTLVGHRPFDHGKADVMLATFSRSPEREQKVNFSSEVYFETEQRFMVRNESKVTSIDDLAGKLVAAIEGTTAELSVRSLLRQSQVPVILSDFDVALKFLDDGRADAFLSDLSILQSVMQEEPGKYRLIDQPLTNELYAAAVTQGSRQLLNIIDQAVWRFKESGEWAASYTRYFGRPVPRNPASPVRTQSFKDMAMQERLSPLEMKDPSLQSILKNGIITFGVKSDTPGFSLEDKDTGEFSGLEIDLARSIARRIFGDPNRAHFRTVATKDRFSELITWRGILDSLVKMYCVLSTSFAYSNWWYLGMAGKLPTFICPEECRYKLDFIGLDYYYGIRSIRPDLIIGLLNAGTKGDFNKAPIWPEALYDHLSYLSKLINKNPEVLKGRPPLPLFILENGWVDVNEKPMNRAAYIKKHVQQVQRAFRDKLNVEMYLYWSLTTNVEWGFPIGPNTDFGLFQIDLKKKKHEYGYQKRIATSDCRVYKDIIEKRGVFS
jgi:beta-glucosidase/6-phospho-beta-glucosidase/beta-galactosidase/ABC-type amino acid transport substrate-binding protein